MILCFLLDPPSARVVPRASVCVTLADHGCDSSEQTFANCATVQTFSSSFDLPRRNAPSRCDASAFFTIQTAGRPAPSSIGAFRARAFSSRNATHLPRIFDSSTSPRQPMRCTSSRGSTPRGTASPSADGLVVFRPYAHSHPNHVVVCCGHSRDCSSKLMALNRAVGVCRRSSKGLRVKTCYRPARHWNIF